MTSTTTGTAGDFIGADYLMFTPEGEQAMARAIQAITDGPVLTPAAAVEAIGAAQEAVYQAGHREAHDSDVRWACCRKIAAAWPMCTFDRLYAAWPRQSRPATRKPIRTRRRRSNPKSNPNQSETLQVTGNPKPGGILIPRFRIAAWPPLTQGG